MSSDFSGVALPGSWKKAIELTSSPEASAIHTLALLDSAVSSAITIVSPQASFQRLGEPVGPHQAPEAAHRGYRRQRRRPCRAAVPVLDNLDRSLTTRITLFPPAPIFVFS